MHQEKAKWHPVEKLWETDHKVEFPSGFTVTSKPLETLKYKSDLTALLPELDAIGKQLLEVQDKLERMFIPGPASELNKNDYVAKVGSMEIRLSPRQSDLVFWAWNGASAAADRISQLADHIRKNPKGYGGEQ